MSSYSFDPKFIPPLRKQLIKTFFMMNETNKKRSKELAGNITEIRKNLEHVEEKYVLGKLEKDLYEKFSSKYKKDITEYEEQLNSIREKLSNLDEFIDFSVSVSSKLVPLWSSDSYQVKQKLQFLVFPGGVVYDIKNHSYRTTRVNTLFNEISRQARVLEEKKGGLLECNPLNSEVVVPTGIEPVSKV